MSGSLRERGKDSWELRVDLGVDADSGGQRWASKTVHGTKRYATARLAEFVDEAGYARVWAATLTWVLTSSGNESRPCVPRGLRLSRPHALWASVPPW